MKRFNVFTVLVVTVGVLVFAGTASAHLIQDGGDDSVKQPGVAQTDSSGPSSSEIVGTASGSTDGGSVTVASTNGGSITCAVPAGIDLTPFLSGPVKAECELVNGVLTLKELKAENGAKVEVGDDGTVEVKSEDGAGEDAAVDDDNDGAGDDNDDGAGDDNDDDAEVSHSGTGSGSHDGDNEDGNSGQGSEGDDD